MLLYGSVFAMLASIFLYRLPRKKWPILFERILYEVRYNFLGNREILLDRIYAKNNVKVNVSQTGRVAVITGGARGIGLEVVKILLELDMDVIIGCRSVAAGNDAICKIRDCGIKTGQVKVFQLDNCSLASVKRFAEDVKQHYQAIHVLINNAGVMFCPYKETEDGFEQQWGVNYLAHFLLSSLLFPLLEAGGVTGKCSRIVNVTSCAHLLGEINFSDINSKKRFITSAAYAQSKLAQVVFTKKLQNLAKDGNCNVQVYSVHPGIVNTDIFVHSYLGSYQSILSYIFKSPEEGAIPIVHAALSESLEDQGGAYISNCYSATVHPEALNLKTQDRLFELSLEQVGLKDFFQAA